MSDEIWIGTVRAFDQGIEGCNYGKVDCALPGTYTQKDKHRWADGRAKA